MKWDIFLHAFLPSICCLWWNVSSLLPITKNEFFFFTVEFWKFFFFFLIPSGYKLFVRYVTCKYPPPGCSCLLTFNTVIYRLKFSMLIKYNLFICFHMDHNFGVLANNSQPNSNIMKIFLPYPCILTFYRTHFQLIFKVGGFFQGSVIFAYGCPIVSTLKDLLSLNCWKIHFYVKWCNMSIV